MALKEILHWTTREFGRGDIVPVEAVGCRLSVDDVYRDAETLRPVSYFDRLPINIAAAEVLLLDPMLATGHSACEATAILKAQGARRIQFLCLITCPPGIKQFHGDHPDVPVVTAAIDPELNAKGYIVPGLGDAGDRYFGTG